jgi:hypothetical protein
LILHHKGNAVKPGHEMRLEDSLKHATGH